MRAALAVLWLFCCSASDRTAPNCPGPLAHWLTPDDQIVGLTHHIVILNIDVAAPDTLRWNGEPISLAQLRSYLEIVRDMEPRPFTVLRVEEGTDCAWLQTVRQAIAQSLPCDKGGCGEGSGWDWDL